MSSLRSNSQQTLIYLTLGSSPAMAPPESQDANPNILKYIRQQLLLLDIGIRFADNSAGPRGPFHNGRKTMATKKATKKLETGTKIQPTKTLQKHWLCSNGPHP
jgi:hypothetical protein